MRVYLESVLMLSMSNGFVLVSPKSLDLLKAKKCELCICFSRMIAPLDTKSDIPDKPRQNGRDTKNSTSLLLQNDAHDNEIAAIGSLKAILLLLPYMRKFS